MSDFDFLGSPAPEPIPNSCAPVASERPKNQNDHLILIKGLSSKRRLVKQEHDALRQKIKAMTDDEKARARGTSVHHDYTRAVQRFHDLDRAVKDAVGEFLSYSVRGLTGPEKERALKIFETALAKYLNPAALPLSNATAGSSKGAAGGVGRGTRQGHQPPPSPVARPRG